MFDLVTDIATYPQFLPWCDRALILPGTSGFGSGAISGAVSSMTTDATNQAASQQEVVAQIGISFGAVRQNFVTRNTHLAQDTGVRKIMMQLVEGPFSALQGTWLFTPVGTAPQNACRIELQLSYDFDSAALAALVGPVFDKIAASMVDAFVKRAEQLYG